MSALLLLLLALAYLALLFGVAWWGDRRLPAPAARALRPWVYGLALGVYCTSWTFFGAVGSAATAGFAYLPIYLGPILVYLLGGDLLRRLLAAAKTRNITSIADFLASRFGRSQSLAALITLVALTAAVPYVALQFKAVALSVQVLTAAAPGATVPWYLDTALFSAALLALFAILFGTRVLDATEHHRGLMLAIAFESVVKLLAFVAVGVYALWLLTAGPPSAAAVVDRPLPLAASQLFSSDFLIATLLSAAAVVCLPRQFHVGVVECEEPKDLRTARWLFPLYLLVFTVLALPIALAGLKLAPAAVMADSYVLWLPQAHQAQLLALLVFIGGFSAATGMVIVVSVALATMVSNELLLPWLSRWRALELTQHAGLPRVVLWLRRFTILLLATAAYAYYRAHSSGGSLAALGLLAFAAVAQFAPGLLFGVYSRRVSVRGVRNGLLVGFLVWIYTLLLPSLAGSGWLDDTWLRTGPWGLAWLKPQALFGLAFGSSLVHGVVWSLGLNFACVACWRLLRPAGVQERLLARVFMGAPLVPAQLKTIALPTRARIGDLLGLVSRVLGPATAERLELWQGAQSGRAPQPERVADRALVQKVERELSAALGATSARLVLTTTLRGTGMDVDEVMAMLDETSQERRFNQDLLHTTMENVGQGVSVVDGELRLVAWNRRYIELFDYPEERVYVGCPVEELIRFNAERGEWGELDAEAQVQKRLQYLRAGSPYRYQRARGNGRVLEMRGQPLPGGGFVTTYSDITEFKRTEAALREATQTLEQRVAERTDALKAALAAQQAAQQAAEAANQSKTRFIAAASHDLLQPLHAARLFMSALQEQGNLGARERRLADQAEAGLRATEELLDGLLDISRLDSGVLQAQLQPVALGPLLRALEAQFAPIAAARGLKLRVRSSVAWVHSDPRLLRRILQNLLANAVRYTQRGGVLLGVRRRSGGEQLELLVADTGPGIVAAHRQLIFEEFRRLERPSDEGHQGLGLGLAIVHRLARLLGHPLKLSSEPGRGSIFSVLAPSCAAAVADAVPAEPELQSHTRPPQPAARTRPLHLLCIDNETTILDGMRELLVGWGLQGDLVATPEAARAAFAQRRPDLVLADYRLDSAATGLDLLRELCSEGLPGVLITADSTPELELATRTAGHVLLRKPVRPAALRAVLAQRLGPF